MTYGLSNGHVIDDVTWPQRCCEAVRSAILATAWLLVITARCTLVQSAVLLSRVVCLSVTLVDC